MASPERTDAAVPGVLDFVDRLKQAGALFFQANPALENRLADIRKQDPRYIAHEFLNQDWHPLMFADIAGEMLEAKCRFIGSATLAENIDTVAVPAERGADPGRDARSLSARDAARHRLRPDVPPRRVPQGSCAAAGGRAAGAAGRHDARRAGAWRCRKAGATFATPIGNVTGRPEVYQPLLSHARGRSAQRPPGARVAAFAGRPLVELMQAFTLLVAGGYAHPMLPDGGTAAGHEAARRLNLAIARANANGADLPRLAAPAIGSAVGADILETLLVGELLAGKPADVGALAGEVLAMLGRGGRSVQRDGKPVTDQARGAGRS